MDASLTKRATLLIMGVFLLQPLALGGWLALIPEIKTALGLTKGQLAVPLMAIPIALVPSLQIAGRVISAFGPRRVATVFFPLQALAFLGPLIAWDAASLFGALFLAGVCMAFVEVAMNVYAGRLEKAAGVLIMNRSHGFWALGLMVGSGTIAVASAHYGAQVGLALVSASFGAAASWVLPRLPSEDSAASAPRRALRALPPALFFIAVFMFVVTLTEGVMADWAAVYMAERLGAPGAAAALAVTVFSAFMAGGRFLGDYMKRRLGAVRHARTTVGLAIAGLIVVVAPLPVALEYLGFAMLGAGVSAAYPLGVSAIAALDDRYEAPNIAFAATMAMGGFLIGPPLIGFVSEALSLAAAFACLFPALVLAMALTRWLTPKEDKHDAI
ncbi:MAG: MFS transporter [Pseudomonadota bacterium]